MSSEYIHCYGLAWSHLHASGEGWVGLTKVRTCTLPQFALYLLLFKLRPKFFPKSVSLRMCIIVQVLIGNREWMKVNNVRVTTKMEQKLQGHEELGHTVALTAVDGN